LWVSGLAPGTAVISSVCLILHFNLLLDLADAKERDAVYVDIQLDTTSYVILHSNAYDVVLSSHSIKSVACCILHSFLLRLGQAKLSRVNSPGAVVPQPLAKRGESCKTQPEPCPNHGLDPSTHHLPAYIVPSIHPTNHPRDPLPDSAAFPAPTSLPKRPLIPASSSPHTSLQSSASTSQEKIALHSFIKKYFINQLICLACEVIVSRFASSPMGRLGKRCLGTKSCRVGDPPMWMVGWVVGWMESALGDRVWSPAPTPHTTPVDRAMPPCTAYTPHHGPRCRPRQNKNPQALLPGGCCYMACCRTYAVGCAGASAAVVAASH
jgi:hypothetical protein